MLDCKCHTEPKQNLMEKHQASRLKLFKAIRALLHPLFCKADSYNLRDMFPFQFSLICCAAAMT